MNNWLYPLSSVSGRWFEDATGFKYPDTSFDSFSKMMKKPSKDNWWYLATNFRNVAIGDFIWCYYGVADGDLGVVGVAKVEDVVHDEGRGIHDILLDWQVSATRKLMTRPVPAVTIRKFINRPRSAVQGLDKFPALLQILKKASGI
jgi:hypothetical protein